MSAHSHVLVGYDGTKESEQALRWAAGEAVLRRMALTVCHAWRWPYLIRQIDFEGVGIVKRMGRHVLDHGVSLAQETAPGLTIRKNLMEGPAAAALMHEAEDAEMIVVGSHEQDALPIGSTALRLPARARCPVIVVRDAGRAYGRVVVGVDGSPGGNAALGFAFEEAALRNWVVQAVYGCWEPGAAPDGDLSVFDDEEKLARVAGATLERSVAPWRVKYPYVEAYTSLVMEPPRQALFAAAEHADLLVVGDRGTGGLAALVLGAITTAILQHVPCSVAVVRSS